MTSSENDNLKRDITNQFLNTQEKINKYEKMLIFNKEQLGKATDSTIKKHYKYIIVLTNKYLKELNQQKTELKKLM